MTWRGGLIALVLMTSPLPLMGQSMTVRAVGDALHVRVPGLAFIEGPVSERLQDGRSVRIDFDLTVLEKSPGPAIARAQHSFNLSFDLWEERFAVTRIGQTPRSMSHLTRRAAEDWCLDNVTVPVDCVWGASLATRRSGCGLSIGCRIGPSSGRRRGAPTFTLQTLIDVLSRQTRRPEQGKSMEAGPFRLPN